MDDKKVSQESKICGFFGTSATLQKDIQKDKVLNFFARDKEGGGLQLDVLYFGRPKWKQCPIFFILIIKNPIQWTLRWPNYSPSRTVSQTQTQSEKTVLRRWILKFMWRCINHTNTPPQLGSLSTKMTGKKDDGKKWQEKKHRKNWVVSHEFCFPSFLSGLWVLGSWVVPVADWLGIRDWGKPSMP